MDGRRYDSRDGGGRVASGTATENNAGAIVETAPGAVAEGRGEKVRSKVQSTGNTSNPLNLLCFYASAFILGC